MFLPWDIIELIFSQYIEVVPVRYLGICKRLRMLLIHRGYVPEIISKHFKQFNIRAIMRYKNSGIDVKKYLQYDTSYVTSNHNKIKNILGIYHHKPMIMYNCMNCMQYISYKKILKCNESLCMEVWKGVNEKSSKIPYMVVPIKKYIEVLIKIGNTLQKKNRCELGYYPEDQIIDDFTKYGKNSISLLELGYKLITVPTSLAVKLIIKNSRYDLFTPESYKPIIYLIHYDIDEFIKMFKTKNVSDYSFSKYELNESQIKYLIKNIKGIKIYDWKYYRDFY